MPDAWPRSRSAQRHNAVEGSGSISKRCSRMANASKVPTSTRPTAAQGRSTSCKRSAMATSKTLEAATQKGNSPFIVRRLKKLPI